MVTGPDATFPRARPLWIALIALGAFLFWRQIDRLRRPQPQAQARTAPFKESSTPARDLFLLDSVLAIAKSYYVDEDRVTNAKLLETALDGVSHISDVTVARDGGIITLSTQKTSARILSAAAEDYQSLLRAMIAIGRVIETSTHRPDDQPERAGVLLLVDIILNGLDPHSAMLSASVYRELRQGTEGLFGGLGVLVGVRDQLLTVIKPIPRSPAFLAGIKRHDHILAINGIETFGASLDELVEHMRGEPGTSVKLRMLRANNASPWDIDLRREIIQVDSATVSPLPTKGGPVPRITIDSFSTRTSTEVRHELQEWEKQHGPPPAIVLDLRGNPGGLLDQAVQVSDIFLRRGVIVSTRGRTEEVEEASGRPGYSDVPVIVVIDPDSASASEIVSGALKDNDRAIVVGQPSFGKGSVQTIFELPDDQALKLTIARYYTPSGRSIHDVGIMPDVLLEPIIKGRITDTPLGDYRYRFIGANEDISQRSEKRPQLRAFFDEDQPFSHDEEQEDPVLDLTRFLIEDIEEMPERGQGIPASGIMRAIGGKLAAQLASIDARAAKYLREKHQVDWHIDDDCKRSITLTTDVARNRVEAGESLAIEWSVANPDVQSACRISLFAVSPLGMAETLVGALGAGERRAARTYLHIPPNWQSAKVPLDVGVAIDGEPLLSTVRRHLVIITDRESPNVTASATLVDDRERSRTGSLEPNEDGTVNVAVHNTGTSTVTGMTMRVVNLSGTQISVDHTPRTVASLSPGGRAIVKVPIRAAASLFTDKLSLGIVLEGSDLRHTVLNRIEISSAPNVVANREGSADARTSH